MSRVQNYDNPLHDYRQFLLDIYMREGASKLNMHGCPLNIYIYIFMDQNKIFFLALADKKTFHIQHRLGHFLTLQQSSYFKLESRRKTNYCTLHKFIINSLETYSWPLRFWHIQIYRPCMNIYGIRMKKIADMTTKAQHFLCKWLFFKVFKQLIELSMTKGSIKVEKKILK